ncbi:MAG TPA: hypothetical protein VLK33_05200 [Terriglobales bacterium]|nr:hypothetical protein [Terriglobales bacterium]
MIATILAILFRGILLVRFVAHAPLAAFPFALSEGLVIGFTVWAVIRGRLDNSFRGALVPLFYCVPLLFSGRGTPTLWAGALFPAALLVLGARLDLLERVTIGAPSLLAIKTDGLYRLCRHPIAATEMVMAALWPLAFPGWRNAAVAVACFVSIYSAAVIEENFLFGVSAEYRRYYMRVRSRFLPNFRAQ